jgi:predicted negative regulator of RcsB-dependent stress response
VDTQTRHALKKDKFAQATASSVSWVSSNRADVVKWSIAALVPVLIAVGGLVFWSFQSSAADKALGTALDTYDAQLVPPGVPVEAGTYASAADRSKAANQQFSEVASKYGWLPEGAKAHYFTGITDEELGQNAQAETELKTAAGSWDHNLSNLAKLALAELYHHTQRDPQAIAIYNELTAKPSATVSANVAQLDLADLYAGQGNQTQARALWAKIKDGDKEGAAGQIAAEKLGGKQ